MSSFNPGNSPQVAQQGYGCKSRATECTMRRESILITDPYSSQGSKPEINP